MKKIIFNIVLLVIIPLAVVFGVGAYAYNRYKAYFPVQGEKKGYFEANTEEGNTESQIKAFLNYYSTYYKEELSKDITNASGKKLFTLKLYSVEYTVQDDKGEETQELQYEFYAYDINYGLLYKEIYTGDNTTELGAYMPRLNVKVIDPATKGTENELKEELSLKCLTTYGMEDYNWVGYTKPDGTETKKNSDNKRITFNDYNVYLSSTVATVKTAAFKVNKDYSENVEIEISVTDPQYASYETSTVVLDTFNVNMVQKLKNYDVNAEGIVKGYNMDCTQAGYFKYALSRYMWWECLIALVLTMIVTVTTTIVWTNSADDRDDD